MSDQFKSNSEKKKYLFCNGATFDVTVYPRLYAILGTNRLPDLRGRFLEGSEIGGSLIESGLPDITGWIGDLAAANGSVPLGGAFYTYRRQGQNSDSGDSYPNYVYYFAASKSNPIYGRSDVVQPPTMTVRYYIRAK